jgi:hypothetical protein
MPTITTHEKETRMTAEAPAVWCDPGVFSEKFNIVPFEVEHALGGSELFSMPKLIELATRISKAKKSIRTSGDLTCFLGRPGEGAKFPDGLSFPDSIEEVVHDLRHNDAWLVLHHVEHQPEYRQILESTICDILRLTRQNLFRQIKKFDSILFITSPNRKTPYHMDRECSWLFQLQGDKEIHLFDRADEEVVTNAELETFWSSNNDAAIYKPGFERRAFVFQLRPGNGVHIPVNTPHWLHNKNNISVSLNVNFHFHDSVLGNIYKSNYYLRRLGFNPARAGRNRGLDRTKSLCYTAGQHLKHIVKRTEYVPAVANEQKKRIEGMFGQGSRASLSHHPDGLPVDSGMQP